jgi:Fe-S cluster biosynthesis and repair protein YggX
MEREGAGKTGLPEPLGAEIEDRICAVCWSEWLQTQIRVINHYGLRPAQREDRERLYELTREFLQLGAPASEV